MVYEAIDMTIEETKKEILEELENNINEVWQ